MQHQDLLLHWALSRVQLGRWGQGEGGLAGAQMCISRLGRGGNPYRSSLLLQPLLWRRRSLLEHRVHAVLPARLAVCTEGSVCARGCLLGCSHSLRHRPLCGAYAQCQGRLCSWTLGTLLVSGAFSRPPSRCKRLWLCLLVFRGRPLAAHTAAGCSGAGIRGNLAQWTEHRAEGGDARLSASATDMLHGLSLSLACAEPADRLPL